MIKLDGRNRHQQVVVDCNCLTRINNVIKTLNGWKSVCKGIVLSDEEIDNLANASATVWQDKLEQKNNNFTKKAKSQHERSAIATKTDSNIQRNAKGDYKPLPGPKKPRQPRHKKQPATDNTTADPSITSTQPQVGPDPAQTAFDNSYAGPIPPALSDNDFSSGLHSSLGLGAMPQSRLFYSPDNFSNFVPDMPVYAPTYDFGNPQQVPPYVPVRSKVQGSGEHQPESVNKKHGRTATMDARLQPQPTHMKCGEYQEKDAPVLGQVDE